MADGWFLQVVLDTLDEDNCKQPGKEDDDGGWGKPRGLMLTDLFTGIYGHTLLFRLLTQITRRAVWKRTETANMHMQLSR